MVGPDKHRSLTQDFLLSFSISFSKWDSDSNPRAVQSFKHNPEHKMPPPISQTPVRALQGSLSRRSACSLGSSSGSATLATSAAAKHQFSTTTTNNDRTPPESPRYITLPEPPQSSETRLPPVRGHLPVPRQIFSKRDGSRKVAPGYVKKTTPYSQAELAGEAPRSELEAWRRRMTESRRRSLADGLKGLYQRKQQADKQARERGAANFEANRRAAIAPERLDDVLTRSSIPGSAALNAGQILDPRRFEVAEQSAARTAARQQVASEARKDALAELYIASKEFIVTEEELEKEVDNIFTEDHFRKQGSVAIDSSNIWDARGPPISIGAMLAASNRSQAGLSSSAQAGSTKTVKRQKAVAEELTGGKMP